MSVIRLQGENGERSCVIKVTCGDKSVDLVVNQARTTQLNKITDAVGGFFKKKK